MYQEILSQTGYHSPVSRNDLLFTKGHSFGLFQTEITCKRYVKCDFKIKLLFPLIVLYPTHPFEFPLIVL